MQNFDSFTFSVVEINKGLAILKHLTLDGEFVCYTVGQGGKSFSKLSAARTFAKRLSQTVAN